MCIQHVCTYVLYMYVRCKCLYTTANMRRSNVGHHVPSYFKQSLSLGLPLSRTILLPHKLWGTLPSTSYITLWEHWGYKYTRYLSSCVLRIHTQVLMLAQQALYSLGYLLSHKICFLSIPHIF